MKTMTLTESSASARRMSENEVPDQFGPEEVHGPCRDLGEEHRPFRAHRERASGASLSFWFLRHHPLFMQIPRHLRGPAEAATGEADAGRLDDPRLCVLWLIGAVRVP